MRRVAISYPKNAEHVSDNRLYGMYHAKSPSHKDVILKSMLDASGVVKLYFVLLH